MVRKTKIAMVTQSLYLGGGSEKHLATLAGGLNKEQYEVKVYCAYKRSTYSYGIERNDVAIINLIYLNEIKNKILKLVKKRCNRPTNQHEKELAYTDIDNTRLARTGISQIRSFLI